MRFTEVSSKAWQATVAWGSLTLLDHAQGCRGKGYRPRKHPKWRDLLLLLPTCWWHTGKLWDTKKQTLRGVCHSNILVTIWRVEVLVHASYLPLEFQTANLPALHVKIPKQGVGHWHSDTSALSIVFACTPMLVKLTPPLFLQFCRNQVHVNLPCVIPSQAWLHVGLTRWPQDPEHGPLHTRLVHIMKTWSTLHFFCQSWPQSLDVALVLCLSVIWM